MHAEGVRPALAHSKKAAWTAEIAASAPAGFAVLFAGTFPAHLADFNLDGLWRRLEMGPTAVKTFAVLGRIQL